MGQHERKRQVGITTNVHHTPTHCAKANAPTPTLTFYAQVLQQLLLHAAWLLDIMHILQLAGGLLFRQLEPVHQTDRTRTHGETDEVQNASGKDRCASAPCLIKQAGARLRPVPGLTKTEPV